MRGIFTRYIAVILLFLLPALLRAQVPYFRKHSLPQQYTTNSVTRILQDSRHFLWFGTTNGLFRFNGIEYKHILQDSAGKDHVTALYEDSKGQLWVGYKSGKIGIVQEDHFVSFAPEEGFPAVAVTGFTEDKQHEIWFSTYGEGIYYFRGRHMYNINTDDSIGLADNFVYTIVKDKAGNIWAGTDRGVAISTDQNKKAFVTLGQMQGLPDNIVTALTPADDGGMWIGTESMGICKGNAATKKFTVPHGEWKYGAVSTIRPFNNNIWVGTPNGIIEVDGKEKGRVRISSEYSPLSGRISDMITDEEGNVWIANNTSTAHVTNRAFRFITSFDGKSIENIQALLHDKDGNIWYSDQQNVYRYSTEAEGTGKLENWFEKIKPRGLNVISMHQDAQGWIWLGTFGEGVYRIEPATRKMQHITESDGLVNNNVLSITGDGNDVWLATLGGVSQCTVVSAAQNVSLNFRNYTSESGIGSNYIYKIFIDSKKRIWFATDGKGITVMENGKFTNYSSKNGLASNVIYSVTEDDKGMIWFSTSNEGVYRFDGKSFRQYSLNNGLRDLSISSVIGDKHGNVLIINKQGIDVLNTVTQSVFYHGQELGINEIDPDLNAYAVDKDNNIWLGTRKGIIKYCAKAAQMQQWPLTRINKVLVFLNETQEPSQHKFAYDQNHISFDYTGFWYHDPEEVTYRIMLVGYDREWVISHNRFITYPNLPPGDYTFKVQSSATNNFQGAPVVSYAFTIAAPFYNTAWFYIVCVLLVLGALYWFIRSRERKLRAAEALKKDKIEFQFETLKSQVNPHFLFNSFNTLIGVIEEDRDTAVEYVEKLSDFYRNILLQREKNVIPLGEELKMIDDYYFLQQKRYKKNFIMSIDVPAEMRNTYIAPLTLQLLVENAVKHNVISREKPLAIDIFTENGYIVVQNNLQRKQHPEPSTGMGLSNIVNRYKLLGNEDVKIEETAAHYKVAIPLLYKAS